jgi:hypothetical protein
LCALTSAAINNLLSEIADDGTIGGDTDVVACPPIDQFPDGGEESAGEAVVETVECCGEFYVF